MAITQNNYFDLWAIISELIGDIWLAIIIGVIAIAIVCYKNKVGYQTTMLLLVLWGSIVYAATNLEIIWAFLLLFVAGLFYYRMNQIFR